MLIFKTDYRIGGKPRYYIADENEDFMQIPDEVRKSVIFVCVRDRQNQQEVKAVGTAFLVSLEEKDINYTFGYIVTAKHVIDSVRANSTDSKVLLRVNKKDGSIILLETNIGDWKFHPIDSSIDVAVLNTFLSQDVFDIRTISVEMAVTSEIIAKESIDIGDEVFITGLFVNHIGRQRNLPIVRVGNIALMPEEPIHTRDLGDIEAYLIEARSIGGLSGSPVFVYMGHMRNRGGSVAIGGEQSLFYWLGLMHGHWDISENEIDVIIEDESTRSVNMGIAIVVPAIKILEVINQPEFMQVRKRIEEEKKNKTAPTPDFGVDQPTKEEFEATLKKVSRKITPSGPDSSKPKT